MIGDIKDTFGQDSIFHIVLFVHFRKKVMKSRTQFLLNIIVSDIWISASGTVLFTLWICIATLSQNDKTLKDNRGEGLRFECISIIVIV